MKLKHHKQIAELKAKMGAWWETYRPKGKDRRALRDEMLGLFRKLTEDENKVRAWMDRTSVPFDQKRGEILEAIFNRIPKPLREGERGPSFSTDGKTFSYDSLKRCERRGSHVGAFQLSEAPMAAPLIGCAAGYD